MNNALSRGKSGFARPQWLESYLCKVNMSYFGDYLQGGQGQIGQAANDEKERIDPLRSHAAASDLSTRSIIYITVSHQSLFSKQQSAIPLLVLWQGWKFHPMSVSYTFDKA